MKSTRSKGQGKGLIVGIIRFFFYVAVFILGIYVGQTI